MGRRLFTLKNKRHMPAWLAWLLAGFLKLYTLSFRRCVHDPNGVLADPTTVPASVFAIWHNRLLFTARIGTKAQLKNAAVLISASRDGEYIASIIRRFGLTPLRGSSSRGGVKALYELEQAARNGMCTVLTVDGPRGPRYCVHPGAALIGQATGVPIYPVIANPRHAFRLRSWDKMLLPWPFTRVDFTIGDPIYVQSGESIDDACERLRAAMLEITKD